MTRGVVRLFSNMPIHLKGFHCIRSGSGKSVFDFVLPVVLFIMGKNIRNRFIMHTGSDSDILDVLQLFGFTQLQADVCCSGLLRKVQLCESWIVKQGEAEKLGTSELEEIRRSKN
jgi:hypothetical protein